MAIDHLFSGSAIGAVCAEGGVTLPAFIRGVIERRSHGRFILFGAHESDPCLTGFDPGHAPLLHAEVERRRLRDEALGIAPESHFARARHAFGLIEEAAYDEAGRLVLPAMTRRRGRIENLAMFVGVGGNFEIWNPHVARETGSGELRELADYRLGQSVH